jgi:hypothetical protein
VTIDSLEHVLGLAESGASPRPGSRRGRRAAFGVGLVALVAAGGATAALLTSGSERTTPVPASGNLVQNSSFESSTRTRGLADGLVAWGDVETSLVRTPVHDRTRAQRIRVRFAHRGGVYELVPVEGGTRYVQSIELAVPKLADGARVDVIIEWYDDRGRLLGYRMLHVRRVSAALVRHQQVARAPAAATHARFVVNVDGGGTAVFDAADLSAAERASR